MLLQAPTKMQRLDIWSYMVKGKLACVLSFLMLMLRLHISLYGHIVLLSFVAAILGIAIFDASITIINSIVLAYLSQPFL